MSRHSEDSQLFNASDSDQPFDWSIGNPHLFPSGAHKAQADIPPNVLGRAYGWEYAAHQDMVYLPTQVCVAPILEKTAPVTMETRAIMRSLCAGNPNIDPETGYPWDSKGLPSHHRSHESTYTY